LHLLFPPPHRSVFSIMENLPTCFSFSPPFPPPRTFYPPLSFPPKSFIKNTQPPMFAPSIQSLRMCSPPPFQAFFPVFRFSTQMTAWVPASYRVLTPPLLPHPGGLEACGCSGHGRPFLFALFFPSCEVNGNLSPLSLDHAPICQSTVRPWVKSCLSPSPPPGVKNTLFFTPFAWH